MTDGIPPYTDSLRHASTVGRSSVKIRIRLAFRTPSYTVYYGVMASTVSAPGEYACAKPSGLL